MMRAIGIVLAGWLACVSANAESLVNRERQASAILGRDFPFTIYLPDGYDKGNLRYPVLYLLHGAGGDETDWNREGQIKATADRLIASGAIPPAIIVMPGCRSCWWVDGAVDRAETSFWNDLVPAVERRYRTIGTRRGRVVAGLSAGGYGAVRFALRYPDRIAAAAALSPAIYADAPPAQSSARTQPPFLKPDGKFDEAAWKAKNYTGVIDGYCSQKLRVAFYLMSGDNDGYGIAFETVTLFKRLYDHQPELTELRIVDGDHTWKLWSHSIEHAMRYVFAHAERPIPMDGYADNFSSTQAGGVTSLASMASNAGSRQSPITEGSLP
jgi:enterochelin esterase-like enzyme